ncbi:hypothetical protein DJ568_12725 [Mucilaginibacter hurinus]|uniref:Uncharacterized protein n=1 Tax=Mucilaginibacter hurinus TaxID=2201324 RepID=A0A367GMI3_9SPHI|nr:hypothetical protein [Mucilaginibacter hurinus]RCH54677.1 hypothetical protein DJ568_12725 [Mucilaginibacter hurinus]
MKNFKKIAFGLMVGALAIGFSAFTNVKTTLATDWYAPISNTLSPTSPAANNFSSYNSTPLAVEPTCGGEEFVCAARFPITTNPPVERKLKD